MINKIRALSAWYTRGLENGAHLRQAVNRVTSLGELERTIRAFFLLS